MKRRATTCFILLCLAATILTAASETESGILWIHDWEEAVQVAKRQDKLIVLTVAVCEGGQIVHTIVDTIPAELERRFNDVTVDPEGRVFAGTMPFDNLDQRSGRLYRLDRDASYTVVLEDVGIPNSMAFTSDGRSFFFIDSLDNVVWKFDYDRETGRTQNRRAFIEFNSDGGIADGMTLDSEDNLWIGMAMGWKVVQYGPDARLKRSIELPARFVTSVAFGGQDLSQLFVTTGTLVEKDERGSAAGALIALRPGATGVPELRSRIGL